MESLADYVRQEWRKVQVQPANEEAVRALVLELANADVWVRDSSLDGLSVRVDNLLPSHYTKMLQILEHARTSTRNILLTEE